MAHAQLRAALGHVRGLAAAQGAAGQSDGVLLRTFTSASDEAAFTAIVRRHGPMVMGVCRRVLRNLQDAEDAFQATFLFLAGAARSLCERESLAGWLHGVAYRMGTNARRAAIRRQRHEGRTRAMHAAKPEAEAAWREVQEILQEEIQRLPTVYRDTFVLCRLESRSGAEAARSLGIKEATVRSRLAKGRALLQRSLARRGVSLSAVLAAAALTADGAKAAVPPGLIVSTVRAAALTAAGESLTAGAVPAGVVTLLKGAKMAAIPAKLKAATMIILCLTLGGVGIGLGASRPETAAAVEERLAVSAVPQLRPRAGTPASAGTGGPPASEAPMKTPEKPAKEKEGFTAWGKEVGGLQAGLGFRPDEHRAYHHGETVTLVVRVRNVGKEEVKFQYLRQFLIETPPTVTDAGGKPVAQPHAFYEGGEHIPVEVTLAPGKEIEPAELKRELRPASESGNKRFGSLYGTGKVGVQYERVFGSSSSGTVTVDPTLSRLATGKLELEIKPDAEVKSHAPSASEKNGSVPEVKKDERTPVPYLVLSVRGSDRLATPCTLTEFDANGKARWSVMPGVDLSEKTKADAPLLDLKDKATQQAVIASVRDYLSRARKGPNAPRDLRVVFGTDAPPDGFPVWALRCCLDAGFGEVRFTGYVPSGGGYVPRLAPGPDGEAPGYKRYTGQLVETNKLLTDYAEAFRRY